MSYSVGIVGATGAVGREMLRQLELRDFPVSELRLFATSRSHGKQLHFKKSRISVTGVEVGSDPVVPRSGAGGKKSRAESAHVSTETNSGIKRTGIERAFVEQFAGLDVVLLSAGGTVSRMLSPAAAEAGAVAVDNSSAFRMDNHVPLVVPEVNPDALEAHQGIVANPNCSTIQMVVALKPIMDAVGLRRVVASTYQSASGTGKKGADELERAARARLSGRGAPQSSSAPADHVDLASKKQNAQERRTGGADAVAPAFGRTSAVGPASSAETTFTPDVFPRDIGFNLFPLIDRMENGCHCYEEIKMVQESRKILKTPDLPVSVTTVRVPVFTGHSLAMWIETEESLGREECLDVLRAAPGLNVFDEMRGEPTPTPLDVGEDDRVWVGRVREDPCSERCLMLWVVANNLRKGAATNAVQIAEELVSMGLLRRKT